MQFRRAAADDHFLAQVNVAEHFCNFRQDFKVLLCRGFGNQQENHQPNSLFVRRIKANGLSELKNSGHGRLQTFDAAMRYGNPMPQTRGAQTFTRKQTISDQRTTQAVDIFKQQTDFFKSPFLAGDVHLDKHLRDRKDGRESVHMFQ